MMGISFFSYKTGITTIFIIFVVWINWYDQKHAINKTSKHDITIYYRVDMPVLFSSPGCSIFFFFTSCLLQGLFSYCN